MKQKYLRIIKKYIKRNLSKSKKDHAGCFYKQGQYVLYTLRMDRTNNLVTSYKLYKEYVIKYFIKNRNKLKIEIEQLLNTENYE
jgi:hypothetical protein